MGARCFTSTLAFHHSDFPSAIAVMLEKHGIACDRANVE
jgi:hypothetical protein